MANLIRIAACFYCGKNAVRCKCGKAVCKDHLNKDRNYQEYGLNFRTDRHGTHYPIDHLSRSQFQ